MTTRLDPITFAVVRNGLLSAVQEMYTVFKRTTMLPVLYEYNDFGCSIYDDRVNMIAEAPGMPIFVGSLDDCIARTLEAVGGVENLHPGDVLVNNHPYLTAGQPADAALIAPTFHDGRVVSFVALRAHMGDLGAMGVYPTNSTELVQEGLVLPALKFYEAGELNEDLIKIIKANSRIPAETAGNFLAGAGALRAGIRAMEAILVKNGAETYYAVVDELLNHGERIARAGLARIPDGTYEYEDFLDDDGVRLGTPVRLHCAVTVAGSEMSVDLSGSSGTQVGPINCPWGYTLMTARFSLKRFVSGNIPANGGEYRPLNLVAPEGSLFNPLPPAPCFLGWVTSLHLSDMIVSALAPAMPDTIPAENAGDNPGVLVLLQQPTRPGRLSFFWDDGGIGHGAKKGKDGMSALIHPMSAGIEYLPAELLESRMPILKHRHELEMDSGGAGEFRGGLGAEAEFEMLSAGVGVTIADKCKASIVRGLAGGLSPSHQNEILLFPNTDRELRLGKKSDIPIHPGDVIVSRPAGGAGYGDPRSRNPEKVAWDVRNGYVSRAQAAEVYGVVLTAGFVVDVEATERLRAKR
jgi:N-methylhydantoinase B